MSGPGRVRTALVTGASSGIGLEIARLLARDGARVLLVARDEDRLRRAGQWLRSESSTTETRTLAIDLSRADAAEAVHAWATAEAGPVDFLVNNAGVGTSGRFATSDVEADRHLLAEGEATGHAHVVVGNELRLAEWSRRHRWGPSEQRRYLIVEGEATLVHEEHLPLVVAAGVYEVRRQREYRRPDRSSWVAD